LIFAPAGLEAGDLAAAGGNFWYRIARSVSGPFTTYVQPGSCCGRRQAATSTGSRLRGLGLRCQRHPWSSAERNSAQASWRCDI